MPVDWELCSWERTRGSATPESGYRGNGLILRPGTGGRTSESSRTRGMPISWLAEFLLMFLPSHTPSQQLLLFYIWSVLYPKQSDYSEITYGKSLCCHLSYSSTSSVCFTLRAVRQWWESLNPVTFPTQKMCENSERRILGGRNSSFYAGENVLSNQGSSELGDESGSSPFLISRSILSSKVLGHQKHLFAYFENPW